MPLAADLRALWQLAFAPIHGHNHRDRLESFYSRQADDYDRTRKTMLWGREELYRSIAVPERGAWLDLCAGTGANLEALGESIHRLERACLLDLSPSLLAVARRRAHDRGWKNVEFIEADAAEFTSDAAFDVVTISYALSMMPDWFVAIDNARRMLRPGGLIGIVDFYVARKFPANGRARHSWWTRHFWPAWFGADNVYPSPDHLPYLQRRFDAIAIVERVGSLRFMPGARVPYYIFLGRRRSRTVRSAGPGDALQSSDVPNHSVEVPEPPECHR